MKKATKLLALLAALVVLVGAFAACTNDGGGTSSGTTSGGDTSGGDTPSGELHMSVNLASEPETIDPALNSAVDGAVMAHHFFEGLFKWVDDGSGLADGTGNAKLELGQAASYDKSIESDGSVIYTFILRDDILWSDGEPVTAYDFEYALKRLANPATAAYYASIIEGVIKNASAIRSPDNPDDDPEEWTFENAADPDSLGVTALDEKTLEIILENECAYFTELLAFPPLFPMRQDTIEANGDLWTYDPATFITNGPYKMEAWEHNSYIHTVKNEHYYDYENLGPESIRYVLMDDQNAMLAGFRSGELDFIEDVPIDEIPALLDANELHVLEYIGTYYLSFNVQAAPFDDARVREAFTLAIDRNHIVENITRTGQVPADGFVPYGIADADPAGDDFRTVGGQWYSVDPADYEANCERARELLAEAGYPDGEGFPAVEYMYNTSDAHRAVGEAMQADWLRELGVNVSLNNQDWNTFLQTRKNGDFQIARDGWISDFNDPISFLDMYVSGSGNNNAQLRSQEFDGYINASRAATDPAERMEILHDAEKFMQDGYIVGPIYYYTNKYMLNDNIDGLYYTPLGYFLFDYCHYK
ncbi:peptide ABC transporter substrate-binding protein [Ruminococcaceae bacterium OttesenSCG-928-O06]|nr:peptide ABC transporter substrate-binding protein [Ruminococcaceae bacterium OttesenSCG-928-O06]